MVTKLVWLHWFNHERVYIIFKCVNLHTYTTFNKISQKLMQKQQTTFKRNSCIIHIKYIFKMLL